MTAFILSGTIAFALYQLLAFTEWPAGQSFLAFCQNTLGLSETTARALRKVVLSAMATIVLLAVLTIHDFATPIDALAKYEVNIIFGFVFGPLFAIWVNSVVVHSAKEDLTRGQIFAAIGLAFLFILGVFGNAGSDVLRQYAKNLSSLKLGVAEVSFATNATKEQGGRDRIASTAISGEAGSYVPGGSNGLQNLAGLDVIIGRDQGYLTEAFTRKSPDMLVDDLDHNKKLAESTIALPMKCLSAWFEETADPGPVEKYLATYGDVFRRLEALNRRAGASDRTTDPGGLDSNLNDVSSDFVRNGLGMASDIAQSTTSPDVIKACKPWYEIYCPPGENPQANDDQGYFRQCLRAALEQVALPPGSAMTGTVQERLAFLVKTLGEMISIRQPADPRGLEALPYFAIARASVMTQSGRHEAAAAILDNWLRERREVNSRDDRQAQFAANPMLQVKDEWLALRIRAMLATYVEEWLEDDDARAATVVRTEHLRNLQATIDGLEERLLKADFFRRLKKSCRTTCVAAFKRPSTCESDEPSARLTLWGLLYTSYVTMEYTYIHRAIEHPDYARKFAEPVNDQAHRLANFDLSCGAHTPERAAVYGQSLLGFAENAVAYSRLRAKTDDQATHQKRLEEAERAVKFGLQIVDDLAKDEQERSAKPYLKRIEPSFPVSVQELLKQQLVQIDKARADLLE